jgi:hypothetical protein
LYRLRRGFFLSILGQKDEAYMNFVFFIINHQKIKLKNTLFMCGIIDGTWHERG